MIQFDDVTTPSDLTKAIRLLRDARALLETGWAQSGYCIDAAGNPVRPNLANLDPCKSPKAVAWCLHGALRAKWDDASCMERVWYACTDALEYVCPPLVTEQGAALIETFNDRWARDVTDVLDLIDRALIAIERSSA